MINVRSAGHKVGKGQGDGCVAGKRPAPSLMQGEAFGTQSGDQPLPGVPHLFGDDPHAASGFVGDLPYSVGYAEDRRGPVHVLFGFEDEDGGLQCVGQPTLSSQVGEDTQQLR